MSRKARIIRNSLIGLIGAIVVGVACRGPHHPDRLVPQFRAAENHNSHGTEHRRACGIGAFYFDEWKLQAVLNNFVIHGKEPATAAPFIRIARAQVDLRLFTSLATFSTISSLVVDRPEVNIIVLADGTTNIPSPREKSTSNKTALETVVDLAVGHFDLKNGMLSLDSRKQPLNVTGNNLRAQLVWSTLTQGYQGQLGMEPIYVVAGRSTPVRLRIDLPVSIRRDKIDFKSASLSTPLSKIHA